MRPGQQNNNNNNNKRMRGRGRKGPNPLSRSYESNGPDVKIRGTAQHIAERYATLARDATSAGDRVMAENYFQHSEHYGRIVAAAQGSFQPAQLERDYDETDDEGEEGGDYAAPRQDDRGNGQFRDRNDGQPRDRNDGQQRDRNDGQPRGDNPRRDRDDNREFRGERQDRGDRQDRDGREGRGDRENGRDQRENRNPRENRDRNFRDRRDQNGQPQARDRSEGGEDDRAPRAERRFDNRERREGGEPSRVSDAEEVQAAAASANEAPISQPDDQVEAPSRRRGRPPRPRLGETFGGQEPTNAEIPSGEVESPASVSADSPAADEVAAPRRRGRPPRKVEANEDAPSEASADAPVKRRPGRPRKVKAEDEGGEDKSELPAFLLATNG